MRYSLIILTAAAVILPFPSSAQTKPAPTSVQPSKVCDLRMADRGAGSIPEITDAATRALKSMDCRAGDIVSASVDQVFALDALPEYLCDYRFAIQRYPRSSGAAFSCVYAGSVRQLAKRPG